MRRRRNRKKSTQKPAAKPEQPESLLTIYDLPDEILEAIFKRLDRKSLLSSTLASPRFNDLISNSKCLMSKIPLYYRMADPDVLTRKYQKIIFMNIMWWSLYLDYFKKFGHNVKIIEIYNTTVKHNFEEVMDSLPNCEEISLKNSRVIVEKSLEKGCLPKLKTLRTSGYFLWDVNDKPFLAFKNHQFREIEINWNGKIAWIDTFEFLNSQRCLDKFTMTLGLTQMQGLRAETDTPKALSATSNLLKLHVISQFFSFKLSREISNATGYLLGHLFTYSYPDDQDDAFHQTIFVSKMNMAAFFGNPIWNDDLIVLMRQHNPMKKLTLFIPKVIDKDYFVEFLNNLFDIFPTVTKLVFLYLGFHKNVTKSFIVSCFNRLKKLQTIQTTKPFPSHLIDESLKSKIILIPQNLSSNDVNELFQ